MRIDIYHHYCDNAGDAGDLRKLLAQLKELVMATKQEVLDAIAAEKAAVVAAIKVLQDKLDAGGAVTAADLDEIKTAVTGIHEDTAPTDPMARPRRP